MVLCVGVDAQGWPIAWEVFPGNTADGVALRQVVELLRKRFEIGRVVVVADRGMISKETFKLLAGHETAPFDYVLGCKLRRSKEVREEVLGRGGRYHKVADNLEIKEVRVKNRRYVVCRNPKEAQKTPRPAKPWWRSSRRPWPGKVKRALWLTGVLPAS